MDDEVNMWDFLEPMSPEKVARLSPLALAYIGDAVFELYVRRRLLAGPECSRAGLHRQAVARVRASAQAEALRRCRGELTAEEADIARRGRNARTSVPRGADVADHHAGTAFEALLGFLYLSGRRERLLEIMQLAYNMPEDER